MSVLIVPARECHAENIYRAEKECFSDSYSISVIKNDVSGKRTCLCAMTEEGFAGYCIASAVLDESELERIAVLPRMRRIGIADALISAVIDACAANGAAVMYLEVRESNVPAAKLYEKHGFEKIGKRKAYYSDNGEDALIYRRNIDRR